MSSAKSSKTWVANPCRQPPSLHSKTQSVSDMKEPGKLHARRLLDEFSAKFVPEQMHRVTWLTAAVTPACNSAIDDSRYSPAQWYLGRGLRLPYTLLDQTVRLSVHERVTRDRTFSERIAMISAAQRSITSVRYDRARSRAVLARSRAWCGPCSTAFPGRRRCVLLERQRKSKARVGCTLAWSCNGHWSSTRVAVVGTPNNDSEMQQGSRSTRNGIRTVATWSDASCSSCTAGTTWSCCASFRRFVHGPR